MAGRLNWLLRRQSLLRDADPGGSLGEITKSRAKHLSQAKAFVFLPRPRASTGGQKKTKALDLSIEGFALNFVGMTGFEAKGLQPQARRITIKIRA